MEDGQPKSVASNDDKVGVMFFVSLLLLLLAVVACLAPDRDGSTCPGDSTMLSYTHLRDVPDLETRREAHGTLDSGWFF